MISDHRSQNLARSILGNVFSERAAKIPDNMSNSYPHFWLFCEYKNHGCQCERVFGLLSLVFCSFGLYFGKVNFGQLLPKICKVIVGK